MEQNLFDLVANDNVEGLMVMLSESDAVSMDEKKVLMELSLASNNYSFVSVLLERMGEEWDGVLFAECTALGRACQKGCKTEILVLLLGKLDANQKFMVEQEVWSPISYCVQKGLIDFVTILLQQHNINVDTLDPSGKTPLCTALTRNDVEVVQLLLQKGADVEKGFILENFFRTPLALAIEQKSPLLVDLLLKRNANAMQYFGDKQYDYMNTNALDYCLKKHMNIQIAALLTDVMETESVQSVVSKIHFLDLSGSNLEFLPLWLKDLPEDVELNLEGNPLWSIPSNVQQAGTKFVCEYLRDISEDKAKRFKWNKAKVMVLGKEGVGKTLLYQRIRGEKRSPRNLSTNGIPSLFVCLFLC